MFETVLEAGAHNVDSDDNAMRCSVAGDFNAVREALEAVFGRLNRA